jgi:His-Xaa-Ser system protein HxsD
MNKRTTKLDDGSLLLSVSKDMYDHDSVLRAAHKFTPHCYLHVEVLSPTIIGVYFKSKQESPTSMEEIIDGFCNELIDEQVRTGVERACGGIRDQIVRKAFAPVE